MLPRDEHTSVLANPRFLQLINLAELVLKSKPKELTPQVLVGMLDGRCARTSSLSASSP
jgi:hypothetical protein